MIALNDPLSDQEIAELDEFLMSDATPEESMDIVTLDGFLTALVIGPGLVPPSVWLKTIWGGEGDGPGQFKFPEAVALDAQGNIYVADSRNHRVQRLTTQGAYSAAWGSAGTAPGQFNSPQGVAIDAQGVLYVADTDNNRLQRINLAGT